MWGSELAWWLHRGANSWAVKIRVGTVEVLQPLMSTLPLIPVLCDAQVCEGMNELKSPSKEKATIRAG